MWRSSVTLTTVILVMCWSEKNWKSGMGSARLDIFFCKLRKTRKQVEFWFVSLFFLREKLQHLCMMEMIQ